MTTRRASVVLRFTIDGFLPEERPHQDVGALVRACGAAMMKGELDNNIRDGAGEIIGAYYISITDEGGKELWETEPG